MRCILASVCLVLAAGVASVGIGQLTWQPSQVNSYTTGYQRLPAVAVAPDGRFLVVWQSDGSPGNDMDGMGIRGRWFGADGAPRGEDFQVNTVTTDDQGAPDVALTPSGGSRCGSTAGR